jgi:hypothetical protein
MHRRLRREDPAYLAAMREAKAMFDAEMAKSAMKGRGRPKAVVVAAAPVADDDAIDIVDEPHDEVAAHVDAHEESDESESDDAGDEGEDGDDAEGAGSSRKATVGAVKRGGSTSSTQKAKPAAKSVTGAKSAAKGPTKPAAKSASKAVSKALTKPAAKAATKAGAKAPAKPAGAPKKR